MRRLFAAGAPFIIGLALMVAPAHADQNQNNNQNPQNPKTHQVVEGESLSSIAQDNHLDSWRPLWNANPQLADPDMIEVGQQITIPDGPTTDRPVPEDAAPVQQSQVNQALAPVSYNYSRPTRHAGPAPSGDIFARIRARESGGRYNANTGNGYYGAYQFNDGTWGGYGGYKHASDAPPAVQDQKAAETYGRRGCSPWPNTCY